MQNIFPFSALSNSLSKLKVVGLLGTLILISSSIAAVQEDSNAQAGDNSAEVATLKKKYKASVSKLCDSMKVLKQHEASYYYAQSDTMYEHKEAWDLAAEESEEVFAELRDDAINLFFAMDQPSEDLKLVVRSFNAKLAQDGQIGLSYRITKKLIKLFPRDIPLARTFARIGVYANDFDVASAYYKKNRKTVAVFTVKEQVLFDQVETLKTNYERELELREKDKTANLPRVEVTIKDKGKFVIELFEDEAPETVGNFINLVESDFYTGHIFHRSIKAYMVHTGFMSMNKMEPLGYTIYDEAQKPNRRHHFRGSVCMWPASSEPNSCGAEFSILHIPGPFLTETNHTVFGRVISGMDVVDNLQRTKTLNEKDRKEEVILDIVPDTIASIKVLNKREGTDYQPNRVK